MESIFIFCGKWVRKNKKENLTKIFPTISHLQASGKRASATLYSGFQGLATATFNILNKLKEGEEYYMINIPAYQPETHHILWEKFQAIRENKKIKGKQLYNPNVSDDILKLRMSHKGLDVRRMPVDLQSPPMYYFVYADVTVIALSQDVTPLAIEIANKEIADGFRKYCEWLWKQSKPFKKN